MAKNLAPRTVVAAAVAGASLAACASVLGLEAGEVLPDDTSVDGSGDGPSGQDGRGPTGEGGAGDGASDGACATGTRACGAACVGDTDPTRGCADPACKPCAAPHATPKCTGAGACAIASCNPGFADCNGLPGDGCETDLTAPGSCGACGAACPLAAPFCQVGADGGASCVSTCTSPATTCPVDICADLGTNPSHCGDCTIDCNSGQNAVASCSTGQCHYACQLGYAHCTARLLDGCETPINADPNCGSCGNNCSARNTTQVTWGCNGTGCAPSCAPGWINCDGNVAAGCPCPSAGGCGAAGTCGSPSDGGPDGAPPPLDSGPGTDGGTCQSPPATCTPGGLPSICCGQCEPGVPLVPVSSLVPVPASLPLPSPALNPGHCCSLPGQPCRPTNNDCCGTLTCKTGVCLQ
jgi:hypothetical protein